MPKLNSAKKRKSNNKRVNLRRPLLFLTAACLLLLLSIFIPKLTSKTPALPSKYLSPGTTDETPTMFNGVSSDNNVPTLRPGETVRVQAESVYGEDVYIVIGDASNRVVLKTIKPMVVDLNTAVTIPASTPTGSSGFHIYYSESTGETIDRASTVEISR